MTKPRSRKQKAPRNAPGSAVAELLSLADAIESMPVSSKKWVRHEPRNGQEKAFIALSYLVGLERAAQLVAEQLRWTRIALGREAKP
jgi:hypothetical protein